MNEQHMVIFDCDGVLVDSETLANGVLATLLSSEGLPTTLAQACRERHGSPARDCVVVEDTPSGVTAAVSAGMPVLGYAADSDERALRLAGAKVFYSLDALPQLLGLA
jgi:beta-phosphoglucomutase-like phosphatase (HAD superfamily)